METSILTSIKNVLGIAEDYTVFDQAIITHINSVFPTLTQLGIGPEDGFSIEDDSTEWEDFLGTDKQKNSVISYMFLKVRLLFDPPQTEPLLRSINNQIEEFESRTLIHTEETNWTDPESVTV